jgi:NAD(P)-dependent dehydrogenase (short-subunit alcohol dehydrogenase family)
MRSPVVVLTHAGRRAGKRIGDWLADAGWDVVRARGDDVDVEVVDAVVHIRGDWLAFAADGSDPSTESLVARGASVVVYLAPPDWDASATRAWCAARQVEMVVLDMTAKVHALAPSVREFLSDA